MSETIVCSLHDVNYLNPTVNRYFYGPSKQPLKVYKTQLKSTNLDNVLDSKRITDFWFIDCSGF